MNWVEKLWLEDPRAWYDFRATRSDSDFFRICFYDPEYDKPFPMKPDIYTYPEAAEGRNLLAYKIAVEQAALDGKPIEIRAVDGTFRGPWRPYNASQPVPMFSWTDWHYRVARPKIAEGHNPHSLTEEQVGTADGWRLLTADEIKGPQRSDVEYRYGNSSEWSRIAYAVERHDKDAAYRTKAAPGAYLPKPSLVPWTLETFRWPDCVRDRADRSLHALGCVSRWITIEEARTNGVFLRRGSFLDWGTLSMGFECSYDRGATWQRCGVEAP